MLTGSLHLANNTRTHVTLLALFCILLFPNHSEIIFIIFATDHHVLDPSLQKTNLNKKEKVTFFFANGKGQAKPA